MPEKPDNCRQLTLSQPDSGCAVYGSDGGLDQQLADGLASMSTGLLEQRLIECDPIGGG